MCNHVSIISAIAAPVSRWDAVVMELSRLSMGRTAVMEWLRPPRSIAEDKSHSTRVLERATVPWDSLTDVQFR